MRIFFAALTLTGLAACGSPPAPDGFQYLSTPTLWAELSRTNDTRKIMEIEAELGVRGATQSPLADEYIGRRTGGTVGSAIYARAEARTGDKNCSDFASSAAAQRFFLNEGGPVSDPHGLDRDGDGNACEWGTTLRTSVSNYRRSRAVQAAPTRATPAPRSSRRCYVGPRGGRYTITASGNKRYGC
ncbi:excalibur calcium-binding domain-containing protein [Paracoccus caeni]|uniref:Excalibur calcium-binding domain-containing protein n=1 Tax=Paracoccus caeni TaxID=657651 RepID=A0A934SH11_9RHOB|nr:excalibur calcium-binding domain-containing protein [Paracoccus caeni]